MKKIFLFIIILISINIYAYEYNIIGNQNFNVNNLMKQMNSNMDKFGGTVGNQMSKVLGSKDGMQDFLSEPMSSGNYQTFNKIFNKDDKSINFQASFCPEGARNKFLSINYFPSYNKTRTVSVKQDMDGDGIQEYKYNSKNISGVCERGYVACSGGTDVKPVKRCSVYEFYADDDGKIHDRNINNQMSEQEAPGSKPTGISAAESFISNYNNPDYTNIVGYCECANDECGFHNQFEPRFLEVINGALILAIENSKAGIAITNLKKENDRTFSASATNFNVCSSGNYVGGDYEEPKGKYDLKELKGIFKYKQKDDYAEKALEEPGAQIYYSDMINKNNISSDSSESLYQATQYKKISINQGNNEIVSGINYSYSVNKRDAKGKTKANTLFRNTIPSIVYNSNALNPLATGDSMRYRTQKNVISTIENIPSSNEECLIKTCIRMVKESNANNPIFNDLSNRNQDTKQCSGMVSGERTGKYESCGNRAADQYSYQVYQCSGTNQEICGGNQSDKLIKSCGCIDEVSMQNMFNDPRSYQGIAILEGISEGLKTATCKVNGKYKAMRNYPEDTISTYTEDPYFGTVQDLKTISDQNQIYKYQRFRQNEMETNQEKSAISQNPNVNVSFQDKVNRAKAALNNRNKFLSNLSSANIEKNLNNLNYKKLNDFKINFKSPNQVSSIVLDNLNRLALTDFLGTSAGIEVINGFFGLSENVLNVLSTMASRGQDIDELINDDETFINLISETSTQMQTGAYSNNLDLTSRTQEMVFDILQVSWNQLTRSYQEVSSGVQREIINQINDSIQSEFENMRRKADERGLTLTIAALIPIPIIDIIIGIISSQLIVSTGAWEDVQNMVDNQAVNLLSGIENTVNDTQDLSDIEETPVQDMITQCNIDNIRIFQGKKWKCKNYTKYAAILGKGLKGLNCCKPKKLGGFSDAVGGARQLSSFLIQQGMARLGYNIGDYFGMPSFKVMSPVITVPAAVPFLPTRFSVSFGTSALAVSGYIAGRLITDTIFASCSENELKLKNFRYWEAKKEDIDEKESSGKCAYISYKKHHIRLGFIKIHVWTEYSYCCFDSIMARIIWDHGRRQLKNRSSRDNKCEGFTANEFQKIDFNDIDYSEWTDYILNDAENVFQSNIDYTERGNVIQPQVNTMKENSDLINQKAQTIMNSLSKGGGLEGMF
jgi:conjugal transfer mating pair stabilization protein TraN